MVFHDVVPANDTRKVSAASRYHQHFRPNPLLVIRQMRMLAHTIGLLLVLCPQGEIVHMPIPPLVFLKKLLFIPPDSVQA